VKEPTDFEREAMEHTNVLNCPDPEAAIALYELMSDISEECWCAGWMSGTEYRLWQLVEGDPDRSWGMEKVSHGNIQLLKDLRDRSKGWWKWDENPEFIGLDQWQKEFEKS
jgi:hypothetical protein